MQKVKKFKSEIAQFSQNKANFPPFFLLAFSSGGIPPPQIPPFLLSSGGTLSIFSSDHVVSLLTMRWVIHKIWVEFTCS